MIRPEDQEQRSPLLTTGQQLPMPVWSSEDKLLYQQTVLLGATQFEKVNDQHVRTSK